MRDGHKFTGGDYRTDLYVRNVVDHSRFHECRLRFLPINQKRRRLREIHDALPDDHGHAQLPVEKCCEDCGEDGRVPATKDDLLAFLLRVAAR